MRIKEMEGRKAEKGKVVKLFPKPPFTNERDGREGGRIVLQGKKKHYKKKGTIRKRNNSP